MKRYEVPLGKLPALQEMEEKVERFFFANHIFASIMAVLEAGRKPEGAVAGVCLKHRTIREENPDR